MTITRLSWLARASLLGLGLLSAALGAAETKRRFDVAAGDAAQTLARFAEQADREIVFSPLAVRGINTNPVSGDFAPREALTLLVAGTRLVATQDASSGAFAVRVETAPPNAVRAAPSTPGDLPKSNAARERDDAAANKDSVVELSPFQVLADADNGYRATSTLAGTRLKTDLKDIGAAVSVVTDEMMRDLGAVNAEDILVYTAGTEVGGMSGNFLGDGLDRAGSNNDARTNPSDNNRVRGLAKITNTRDYFVTDIPFNNYNSTALTISRGPNAILAGAGSPGGVLDRSLKTAAFKNRNEVTARIGSHGAHRETLDITRVLIPNRLSGRFVLVDEDLEYNQRPATMTDKRLFGALTWRVQDGRRGSFLGATTVRANYETGTIQGTPPNPIPPINGFASFWVDNKPRFNAVTNVYTNGSGQVLPATGLVHTNAYFRNFTAFYNQPDATSPLIGYSANGFTNVQGLVGTINGVAGSQVPVNRTYQATNPLRGGLNTIILVRMAEEDRAIFDFRENLLTGAFDFVKHKFHANNVRLEQLFWDGRAGVELVADDQRYNRRNNIPFSGSDAVIKIDITQVHANGQPNPNYGRPFIVTQDINGLQNVETTNRSWRATAFYIQDFRESRSLLGRLLGTHTLTGLATSTTTDRATRAFNSPWLTNDPTINLNSLLANPGLFARNARGMIYLGGSADGLASASSLRLSPVTTRLPSPGDVANISFFDPVTNSFRIAPLTVGQITKSGGMRQEKLESKAVSLQSHWLHGHLITLSGLRRDSDTNYTAADPVLLSDGNIDPKTLFLPKTPSSINVANSPSFSVVGVLPEKLRKLLPFDSSLRAYWNTSKNFTPSGQRRNSFNEEIGTPDGKTTERGLMLTAFGGKLDLRMNWFKTSAQNASDSAVSAASALNSSYTVIDYLLVADANRLATRDWGYSSFPTFTDAALAHFNALPKRLRIGDAYNFNPRMVRGANGTYTLERAAITNVTSTTDYVAKGLELEAAVNVTKNWRISANVVKTETVKSSVGTDLRAYVNDYLANLQRANPQLLTGARQPGQAPDPWGSLFNGSVAVPLQIAELTAGSPSPELVKWRWNLVNRYDFTARALKGLYVGGAVRWQDRAAIGYPFVTNSAGVQIADLAHPYFGKTDFRGDAFVGYRADKFFGRKLKWSLQLNTRNIIGSEDLIVVTANFDGTPGALRMPPEKAWFLTSTFQF
ncbi:MAG: TonB-dependent receptor plug domain-containing protein [Opitutaceae bacterium]